MLKLSLGSSSVMLKLDKLAEMAADFSEPFDQLGDSLLEYYGNVVFEQNGPDGEWPDLAPSTLNARLKHYGWYKNAPTATDKTLVWTGIMKNSFYKVVDAKKLTIGNEDPKFRYHQLGGGNTPQRKMLALNNAVVFLIKDKITTYVTKMLNV